MKLQSPALWLFWTLLLTTGWAVGQEPPRNTNYLREHPALQVRVKVQTKQPSLEHLIAQLHEATGLQFELDDNLKQHQPDFGQLMPSKKGFRAWQIMEMIADTDLDDGVWEPTRQGYRLTAATTLKPSPPAAFNLSTYLIVGNLVLLAAVVLLVIAWRRRRSRQRSALSTPV